MSAEGKKEPMQMSERIARYLAELPPAIAGQKGHDATLYAACRLFNGFALTEEETLYWLKQYNARCQPEWSDAELQHKAKSAASISHNLPRGHLIGGNGTFHREDLPSPKPTDRKAAADPAVEIQKYLGGYVADETVLWDSSPVKLTGDWSDDGVLLISSLFNKSERINVVSDYTEYTKKETGEVKANPAGYGDILLREEMLEHIDPAFGKFKPGSAGSWLRINPVDGVWIVNPETGKKYTNSDENVTAFRHALIEFDRVPIELQLSFLSKAPLPIAAIITSGGKSIHAWLKIDAVDFKDYESKVLRLREVLTRFGIDRSNKNPSRLSRLPGVQRTIGATSDGRQRLLYLNPDCAALDIEKLERDFAVQPDSPVTGVTGVTGVPNVLDALDGQDNVPKFDNYDDAGNKEDVLPGNEEPWPDGAVKKGTLPPIVKARDFQKSPVAKPSEIIKGLMHMGTKLVIGGGSKAFKTWTQLDMAVSVSEGLPWINFDTVKSKVLYCNFEILESFFWDRVDSVCRAHFLDLFPENLEIWNLRGHSAGYEAVVPEIIQRIKSEGFGLIIMDPIYKLYGNTDENSAGEVAKLLNALETICIQTGAAVAFGAHYSKGNQSQKESIDRISGSGVFARDPDSIVSFTKHQEEDAFTIEPTLRNLPPIQPFVVRWKFPRFERDSELNPSDLKQSGGRKKEYDPVELLDIISDTSESKPISIKSWALAGNLPRNTLSEYLPDMRRQGWIRSIGEGTSTRQFITEKGLKILGVLK